MKSELGPSSVDPTPDIHVLERMVLNERYINDGSPTGLTWKNSSSPATCPRKGPRTFALPLLRVPSKQCLFSGTIPPAFELGNDQVLFGVHPDCVHLLSNELYSQLIFDPVPPVMVMPTASPRTVLLKYKDWVGFLKLDYPFVLGRFPRDLNADKLNHGVFVSSLLEARNAKDHGIYYFPESGAIEIQASTDRRSGMLFREGYVAGPQFSEYITFCSLFSQNYFSDNHYQTLLVKLSQQYGGMTWIWQMILRPLLESLWKLVLEFGLWPEAHAQNIILGINNDGSTGIIWRDGQGFRCDEEFSPSPTGACRSRVLRSIDPDRFHRRSFFYDWTLGHYVLDPLLDAADESYPQAKKYLMNLIIEFTRTSVGKVPFKVFPQDEAYGMSLEEPKGRFLPIEKVGRIIYR